MAYSDIYTAATAADSSLRKQIAVAMFKAAIDIVNESDTTDNHDNRLVWARKVTGSNTGPDTEAAKWIWKVLENETIQGNPGAALDADVQLVVNGILSYIVNV